MEEKLYTLHECFEQAEKKFPFDVDFFLNGKVYYIVFISRFIDFNESGFKVKELGDLGHSIHYDNIFANLKSYRLAKMIKFNDDMKDLLS